MSRNRQSGTFFALAAVVALSLTALGQDQKDLSALLQAAYKGETIIVKQAIAKGTDPNIKDDEGRSLLTYAVNGGHADTVTVLLSNGAHPNGDGGRALLCACINDYGNIAHMLIEAGADVNLTSGDKYKRTPLYEACHHNDVELARYLLNHGADSNLADSHGMTPLMMAALGGEELVKLLIENRARVDQKEPSGVTALMCACRDGNLGTAEVLIAAGADVTARLQDGSTPLFLAAAEGHSDVMRFLLKAGADANARADQLRGATPLMAAAKRGNLESVNLLLQAKADIKATDTEGHTVLMYAAISAKEDVLAALIKAGALVNAVDLKGKTALFAAYKASNPDAVRALLRLGVDPSIRDNDGKQAADYAPQQK